MMTGPKSGAAALIVLALSLATVACGGNPVGPTPPPTPGPGITGVSPTTGYSNGGTAVTITGTNFQGGAKLTFGGIDATSVWVEPGGMSITATTPAHPAGVVDIAVTNPDGRIATLTGAFTYTNLPVLSMTSFLAFGDSITEGKVGTAPGASYISPGYPAALQALLRDRFASQASSIAVNNAGLGGEVAEDGRDRLPRVLDQYPNTNVVILLEGANDLIANVQVQYIVQALDDMVRIARGRNKQVFLTTLTPVVAPVWGGTKGVPPEALNVEIKKLAASEGVPLIDMYAAFGSSPGLLLSNDGLHPSEAGYQKMAQVYFSEIIARYAK